MTLVTFTLADEEYAVDISQVREVIKMRKAAPVPDTAEFVEGVIHLRDNVIPLANLRKKLRLCKSGLSEANRILITLVNDHFIGVAVDSVNGVLSLLNPVVSLPRMRF